MQLEIDSLREQITEFKIENTRLKNIIDTKEENDITNSDNNSDTAGECSTSYYYPRHIQFIINYISSWSENQISKVKCATLYQKYLAWCKANRVEPYANNALGKKFSQIGIVRKRTGGSNREWQYVLDRKTIINKIHEQFSNKAG